MLGRIWVIHHLKCDPLDTYVLHTPKSDYPGSHKRLIKTYIMRSRKLKFI